VCSYHLNLLGRYGLIEETGDGKGRARPWRLVMTSLSYVYQPGEDRSTAGAADQLARMLLARDVRLIADFIAGRHELPDAWRNVATMSSNPLRLTSEQLGALGTDLAAVVQRYMALSQADPPGGHPVHLALYAVPAEFDDLAGP
jgi:hypothetical protein